VTQGAPSQIPVQRGRYPVAHELELTGDAWGSPDDPPVLLLHGGGQTRHSWAGTAEQLAREGWYAVSIDLRGHGDSDWHADGIYHWSAFAEDVTHLARQFEQPPVLVGASLGGISSLLAVADTPQPLAAALVLVDIAPRMEREGVERIKAFMRARPDGFESLEEAAEAIAQYLPHRPRRSDPSGLSKNLRRHQDGRYRWHWDPLFLGGERNLEVGLDRERLDRAARSLRLPTLLVRGRMSEILSEEGAQHFRELVPHARYADVSDAGHMVAGDRNDAFTQVVIEFLLDLRSGN
jgi:pimeloyl-ACP methyl ester carboxylesterase